MFEPKLDFIEVITREGVLIEVRDRASNTLVCTMEPELFAYALQRAWDEIEVEDREEESDG